VLAPITSSQTTVTPQSTANFGAPSVGFPTSVAILDAGNPAYNPNSPFATSFEYQPVTLNVPGTNTLTFNNGVRGAYANTTPKSYFPGAIIAAVLLAEDLYATFPFAYSTATPSGVNFVDIAIPSGFTHARLFVRAIDSGASGSGQFALLQVGVSGGAVDIGAHYNWAYSSSGGDAINTGTSMPAAVASGGGATPDLSTSIIDLPFYAKADWRPQVLWHVGQSNVGAQAAYAGSGVYWAASGPVTTVRLYLVSNNFASPTTVELEMRP
jgi:hypothetical protein